MPDGVLGFRTSPLRRRPTGVSLTCAGGQETADESSGRGSSKWRGKRIGARRPLAGPAAAGILPKVPDAADVPPVSPAAADRLRSGDAFLRHRLAAPYRATHQSL